MGELDDAEDAERSSETLIDRALKELPTARAPSTLLPRVLAAVAQPASPPWYSRAWFTWPRGWQAISVAALIALLAGLSMAWPSAKDAVGQIAASLPERASSHVASIASSADATATFARILWRLLVEPTPGLGVGP